MADLLPLRGHSSRPHNGIDWSAALHHLSKMTPGDESDDLIDAATDAAFTGGAEAAPFLKEALRCARSTLTIRSAALALAAVAPPADIQSVDALINAYRRAGDDPFLAPALLESLGTMAMRSHIARTEISGVLFRLRTDSPSHLLVKAAQVIGRLDALAPEPALRQTLGSLADTDDFAVRAEVRQQLALVTLADALQSPDRPTLRASLTEARAAFMRAEASEEQRPDAKMFRILLDMMLAFLDAKGDRGAIEVQLIALATDLNRVLTILAPSGYASDHTTMQAQRIFRIADALQQAASAASTAEEWTNFGAALENLARLHAQIRDGPQDVQQSGRFPEALSNIADTVFAATLGPMLNRVISQTRLARITRDYTFTHGEDSVAQSLHALQQAAAEYSFAPEAPLGDGVMLRIAGLASRTQMSTEDMLNGLVSAVDEGNIVEYLETIGISANPLPIEHPALYGEDPSIDEVVRPLLRIIREQIGSYPLDKWGRLVNVLVSIVQFVQFIRDTLPDYLKCREDGGLGQSASESNLQEDCFRWLRQGFGTAAGYETARTGGGRTDTGIVFPEARFPIEVKHEFTSIAPEYIRTHFLTQSDTYAAATDQIAFLMVLDLRERNAAGHRTRRRYVEEGKNTTELIGLYHLKDSFRIERLPTDPDIPRATPKITIVGLVPGNRPLPSSTSVYSRRPANARRPRVNPRL